MSKTIQIELPEGVSESDVKIEFVVKPKPKTKLWVPRYCDTYYLIDSDGEILLSTYVSSGSRTEMHPRRVDNYNAYPTRQIADKAADYLATYRMLVRTALEIDPDFEPDWADTKQEKWFLYMEGGHYRIGVCGYVSYFGPVVSTREKAEQWLELVKAVEAEQ